MDREIFGCGRCDEQSFISRINLSSNWTFKLLDVSSAACCVVKLIMVLLAGWCVYKLLDVLSDFNGVSAWIELGEYASLLLYLTLVHAFFKRFSFWVIEYESYHMTQLWIKKFFLGTVFDFMFLIIVDSTEFYSKIHQKFFPFFW